MSRNEVHVDGYQDELRQRRHVRQPEADEVIAHELAAEPRRSDDPRRVQGDHGDAGEREHRTGRDPSAPRRWSSAIEPHSTLAYASRTGDANVCTAGGPRTHNTGNRTRASGFQSKRVIFGEGRTPPDSGSVQSAKRSGKGPGSVGWAVRSKS